jgi:hypothetical protein
MIDFAELAKQRAAYKKFTETELGKLFVEFDHALGAMWRADQNDRISNKRLNEICDKESAARRAFVQKLQELTGTLP